MESVTVEIAVDGDRRSLTFPLTIEHSLGLRRQLGWSQQELLEQLTRPDLDVIAVCVWLSRVQAGETVSFAEVAGGLSYESKFELDFGGADDHPES